jgi:hypothetical protein
MDSQGPLRKIRRGFLYLFRVILVFLIFKNTSQKSDSIMNKKFIIGLNCIYKALFMKYKRAVLYKIVFLKFLLNRLLAPSSFKGIV